MSPLSYRNIQPADICEQTTQLHNRQFDDTYHHSNAVAESRYVFHDGNELLKQWQNNSQQTNFVIGETGFGSGLNFLTTRQLWQSTCNKPGHLHFISTEQWLLTPAQLQRAYRDFPDLQSDLDCIQAIFKQRRAGFHHCQTDKDITLSLLLGDAASCFQQLNACVDAWYLDGFSPAKNPAMWSLDLMTEIARLSKPGSTFATFTAASQVRKNLQKVGFEVTKTAGFQGKRERLIGQFKHFIKPTHDKQVWAPTPQACPPSKRLTIIGGGIAGLCLAQTAKNNDFQVTLVDQQPQPFAGASGNAYAMMMPYLTAQSSPEALFYWRAFEAALNFYPEPIFNSIGVQSTEQPRKQDARLDLPDNLIQAGEQGLRYPDAGFIDTTALVRHLSESVDVWLTAKVEHIEQTSCEQWLIQDGNRQTLNQCDVLVVAAGIQSFRLLPDLASYLTALRGQTELYHLPKWPSAFDCVQLKHPYLIPIKDQNRVLLGGNYQHLNPSDWFKADEPTSQDPQLNLKNWQKNIESVSLNEAQLLSTHVGIRAHTLDHMPLCGPLVKSEQFRNDYADLHHGRHWQSYPPASVQNNLYVLSGLGSRGYTSAPLLANYLMAMILGQPLPLEQDLVKILHPNRFLYRQLKKPPED